LSAPLRSAQPAPQHLLRAVSVFAVVPAAAAAAAICCPHMTLGGGSSSHGDVCPEEVAAWIAAPYIDSTRIHLLTTCYRWTIFCRQCGMRRLSV
jgi:hypothetical protein